MRILLMLALALPLAGCYTVNQAKLGNFVTDTVQPGMPLEQAVARMRVEGFSCATSSAGTVTVCTRTQERLMRGDCVERVDLMRSTASAATLGAVDILEVQCAKIKLW